MSEVTFGYTPDKPVLKKVNFDVGLDSRIAIVGANGAGKSTVYVCCEQNSTLLTFLTGLRY
jgi:ABC-type bacteriocin/lantibiotic exporter with double-glycine peptidase domain